MSPLRRPPAGFAGTWLLLSCITGCHLMPDVMNTHSACVCESAVETCGMPGACPTCEPCGTSAAVEPAVFEESPPSTFEGDGVQQAPPPSPAPSRNAELSLDDLEHLALQHNPTLAERWADVEAARGRWVQVGLPPNTDVGYSGQQLGSTGRAEQQGVYLGQKFILGGKLNLNRAVAQQEIAKAEQLWAAQRQRVLTDVRLGYYDVLLAQRRVELTENLVGIAEQALETAEKLFKGNEVSRVDVTRAQVELQVIRLILTTARIHLTAAWNRLSAVLGTPHMPPQRIAGDIEPHFEEIDYNAAVQRLLAASPEVAAAAFDVERARWSVERAYAEPIPDLDVQAVLQHDNDLDGTNGNLQVSIPIPWLNRNQGGIKEAHEQVIAAEQSVRRVELSLRHRLATVFQQFSAARAQVEEYSKEGGILDNSKSTLDLVRTAYSAGELPFLDLLAAQRTYEEANLAYLEALSEWWQAKLRIDGLLLADSLESAEAKGQ